MHGADGCRGFTSGAGDDAQRVATQQSDDERGGEGIARAHGVADDGRDAGLDDGLAG